MKGYTLTLTFATPTGEQLTTVMPIDEITGDNIQLITPLCEVCASGLDIDFALRTLRRKNFRKDIFVHACVNIGSQLAERMEDAEGWHDVSRIEPAKRSLRGGV